MSNFTARDLEDMNLEEYFNCGCSLIPAPERTHLSVLAMREIRALRTQVAAMEAEMAFRQPEIKLVCKVKIDGMGVPDDGLRRPIDLIRDALQKLLDR